MNYDVVYLGLHHLPTLEIKQVISSISFGGGLQVTTHIKYEEEKVKSRDVTKNLSKAPNYLK